MLRDNITRRSINAGDAVITYTLIRKSIKNMYIRVKDKNNIVVSANRFLSVKKIDGFVASKADFIRNAIEKLDNKQPMKEPVRSLEDLKDMYDRLFRLFEGMNLSKPGLAIRRMKTRWGSCRPGVNRISLNTGLMYVPERCAEYVIVHEFSHLVHCDHSKAFWALVEEKMPDYRIRKNELKRYRLS